MVDSTQHLRKVAYPSGLVENEGDHESPIRTLQESNLQVDCSFEASNDAPLCDFATSYGLCDYLQPTDEPMVSDGTEPTGNDVPNASLDSLAQLYVSFDYEIHYETASNEAPVDFVKGYLMQHLAINLGLQECAMMEEENGNAETRRFLATENDISALPIVGLSTGLPDQLANRGKQTSCCCEEVGWARADTSVFVLI